MPIYEYKCRTCGQVTEEMLSSTAAESLIKCPVCGNEAEKIISNTSFHLKGSGWYATDYKKPAAPEKPAACPAADSGNSACAGCTAAKSE